MPGDVLDVVMCCGKIWGRFKHCSGCYSDIDEMAAIYSYDHLDLPSIMAIHERFPDVIYFVPLGKPSLHNP